MTRDRSSMDHAQLAPIVFFIVKYTFGDCNELKNKDSPYNGRLFIKIFTFWASCGYNITHIRYIKHEK